MEIYLNKDVFDVPKNIVKLTSIHRCILKALFDGISKSCFWDLVKLL